MKAELVFLSSYLAPLAQYLRQSDITDIYVNRPEEVWTECSNGTIENHHVPGLDDAFLWRLARQVAAFTHQGINRTAPLLSASLPDGARIQFVAPPATHGCMALAIRKHILSKMSLSDYADSGGFSRLVADDDVKIKNSDLNSKLERGDVENFLKEAVSRKLNIVISGGTSSGKTTFLNALMREIPSDERLIYIEDTAELQVEHSNSLGLIAVKGELGEARVTTDDLLQASLRMRPDRIFLGELRGKEAYSFLRAINTGHPGSITTIHANSPRGAVEQLALMVLQAGTNLGYADIVRYVHAVIDVFIQLERDNSGRKVAAITYNNTLSGF